MVAVTLLPSMPCLMPGQSPNPNPKSCGEDNIITHSKFLASISKPRPRRERPCDSCRRRKTRCVIQEGSATCALCENLKQNCTFVENPLPRKRKLDEGKKADVKVNELPKATDSPTSSRRRSTLSSSSAEVYQHEAAGNVRTPGPVNGLAELSDSKLIGSSTVLDASIFRLLTFSASDVSTSRIGHVRRVNSEQYFLLDMDQDSGRKSSNHDELETIAKAVHPYSSFLTNDLYFPFIHRNYPIINRNILLGESRERMSPQSPELIVSVCLSALDWWDFRPGQGLHSKPDVGRLQAMARKAVARIGTSRNLASIQAGLLLLQRPEHHTWEFVCRLIGIAQDVGLHLNCSNWMLPSWEKRLRRINAWALYMQDKWSALTYGRPSHIRNTEWSVEPLTSEDFAEEITEAQTLNLNPPYGPDASDLSEVIFCQMVWLTGIVAEILDDLYSQKASQDFDTASVGSTRAILIKAKPLQMKLKAWLSRLPTSAKMETATEHITGSKASLHLAYFAAEITLHRRIISSLDPNTTEPQLMYICRSAAKARFISAMEFVNRLRPEHLQSFWHFPSAANFALIGTFGSLLQATAPGQEEAEFYKARLQEYRWTLCVSSERAPFLRTTVETLDALREVLRDLGPKPTLGHEQAEQAIAGTSFGEFEEVDYASGMPASTSFSSDRAMSRFGSTPDAPSLDGMSRLSTATSSAASVGYE